MFKSPRMRHLDNRYKEQGGIRAYCLELFADGDTFKEIAARLDISKGALQHYMRKWRKERTEQEMAVGYEPSG